MFITLKQDWDAINADSESPPRVTIPAGRHEFEEIPNPFTRSIPWYVLKGTRIGAGREFWKHWRNEKGEPLAIIER